MTTAEFKANILPHYKSVYRVAVTLMGNSQEAADIVQDVMLRLWDRRNGLVNVENIRMYCVNMTRNACLNALRSKKAPSDTGLPQDLVSDEDIHKELEWREASEFINMVMEYLPKTQKNVLRLSAFGGLSNAEIAELTGISQGNVRVLLSRARARIKELYKKTLYDNE